MLLALILSLGSLTSPALAATEYTCPEFMSITVHSQDKDGWSGDVGGYQTQANLNHTATWDGHVMACYYQAVDGAGQGILLKKAPVGVKCTITARDAATRTGKFSCE